MSRTAYLAYGSMNDLGPVSPVDPAREKFTGKELDPDGKSDNGAPGIGENSFGWRMYDPEVGVWSGADPAEQDWNVYAYCGGNSVNFVDPDGLESSSSEGDWDGCYTITHSDGSTETICMILTDGSGSGSGDGSGGGTTDKILGGSIAHNTGPSPDYQGPVRGPVVEHLRFEAAPPLKPMTNRDVAGFGKALVQGAMPGAPVEEGGGAPSSGMDLLRSPRFNADGSITLNPRGLPGSFGVPVGGGILGTGLGTTIATSVAMHYAPEVALNAWRSRVAIERAVDKYVIGPAFPKIPIPGTPFSLARNLPGTAANALLAGGSALIDYLSSTSGSGRTSTVATSNPLAPDATRVSTHIYP